MMCNILLQFFDKNGDGLVSLADLSSTLPVGKLPKVEEPPWKARTCRRDDVSTKIFSGEPTDGDRLPSDMNLGKYLATIAVWRLIISVQIISRPC